jgi:hypothetical protein
LERLSHVVASDRSTIREIRDRSRNLQHAVVSSRAQTELLRSTEQQVAAVDIQSAVHRDGAAAQICIRARTVIAITRSLTPTRGNHSIANGRGRFTGRRIRDGGYWDGRHFHN